MISRELAVRPDNKGAALELANLLKDKWKRWQGGVTPSGTRHQSEGDQESERRSLGDEMLYAFTRAVRVFPSSPCHNLLC